MVPHPPSSGERQAQGKSVATAGNGRLEKAPGTPRKDGGATKEKAMQDPGLKEYVRHFWLHYYKSFTNEGQQSV